jgi:hypothetical protein
MLPSGNSSAAATSRRRGVSSVTRLGSGMVTLRLKRYSKQVYQLDAAIDELPDRDRAANDESGAQLLCVRRPGIPL